MGVTPRRIFHSKCNILFPFSGFTYGEVIAFGALCTIRSWICTLLVRVATGDACGNDWLLCGWLSLLV